MKTISLIIPVYNEESNLKWHHEKIDKHLKNLSYKYEILYVDDGSSDQSFNIIRQLVLKYKEVRYVRLSRNFGKEAATSAGLNYCVGDAAIIIDADGQHPIECIDTFIKHWENGSDVVVGVRESNKGEGFVKKYGSIVFYKILNMLTNDTTTPSSTDFRLIDRKVIREFNKLTERTRITRGLIDWLGFNRTYVKFHAIERVGGVPTYSFNNLLKLAVAAFVSNSTRPLKIVGVTGIFVTFVSGILGIFLLVENYILNDPLSLAVSGGAFLAIFLSFLVGIVLICQGLLALYIESIHNETQNRPLYIISDKK